MTLENMGRRAKAAARQLALAESRVKDEALRAMAGELEASAEWILGANARDVGEAREAGLSSAMIDRLRLNPERLSGMADGLRQVAGLPDPVGESFDAATLPNGLRVEKRRVPLGVLGVIYEARPNVTVDVAGLALKTGNAVILRGGSETLRSNRAIVEAIRRPLAGLGLPADAIGFIDDADRGLVLELLRMADYVDLVIPRGGASLHDFCRKNSLIPVITGGVGICHLFVDESADLDKALAVIRNAKIQRPTVCNALDTVLVHEALAGAFVPRLVEKLERDGVSFRCEPRAMACLSSADRKDAHALPASVAPAGPKDFDTEWLSLVLGVKVVGSLDEAMAHIAEHSTGHSDGILTADETNASRFAAEVDSAAVYVNASTRFTDGGQLGLGAEVAISTQRLHARGPMGLRELTTYKWVIRGDWHVRP